jgi:hypothetical protein
MKFFMENIDLIKLVINDKLDFVISEYRFWFYF